MLRRLFMLTAALSLAAAACSSNSVVLATVNGLDVTYDDLDAMLVGQETTVLNSEQLRQDLATFIIQSVIITEAEALSGTPIVDDEVREWIDNPPLAYADTIANVQTDSRFSDAAVQRQVKLLIARQRVAESEIAGDQSFLDDIWNNNRAVLYVGCVRQLRTETQDEALAAYDRVVAGEDFVSVAEDVSIDVDLGGQPLPDDNGRCPRTLSGLLPEFTEAALNAEVGVVTTPFRTDAGWHVLLVDSRFGPTSFDEWSADPLSFVTPSQIGDVFVPWYNGKIRDADISINDAVGNWSTAGVGITPPES